MKRGMPFAPSGQTAAPVSFDPAHERAETELSPRRCLLTRRTSVQKPSFLRFWIKLNGDGGAEKTPNTEGNEEF